MSMTFRGHGVVKLKLILFNWDSVQTWTYNIIVGGLFHFNCVKSCKYIILLMFSYSTFVLGNTIGLSTLDVHATTSCEH